MDQVDYEALTQKLGEVTLQNKQLKRANINMKCEVKHLRRLIKKMKDEAAKDRKPNYKNKKRGNNHGNSRSVNR
jgi:predicted RNase H-like nuclease (RuvC/YqgF family)